jgi:hypothetical protein
MKGLIFIFILTLLSIALALSTDLETTYRLRTTICSEVSSNKCGCNFNNSPLDEKYDQGKAKKQQGN